MRFAIAGFLLIHGLIHVMGFAKAFGLAELPQIQKRLTRPMGLLWLGAALLLVAAAALLLLARGEWRWVALMGALLSQGMVLLDWQDAKAGTLANLGVLLCTWFFPR